MINFNTLSPFAFSLSFSYKCKQILSALATNYTLNWSAPEHFTAIHIARGSFMADYNVLIGIAKEARHDLEPPDRYALKRLNDNNGCLILEKVDCVHNI